MEINCGVYVYVDNHACLCQKFPSRGDVRTSACAKG